MNKKLIKRGTASKNLYRLFIIFLLFTFLITAGSLVLKYSIVQKLDKLSSQFSEPSKTQDISNILLDLNKAENDFQQAGLYGHIDKLEDYKLRLKNIFGRIKSVLREYQADSAKYFPGSKQHISESFEKKLLLSQKVFVLRHDFDSLLRVTTIESINAAVPQNLTGAPYFKQRIKQKYSADTTVSINNKGKKNGLFKRLKDAIINKNQATVKTLTIRREKQVRDSAIRSLNRKHGEVIGKLLQELNQKNSRLVQSNKQLIAANLSLVGQLHDLLQQLRDIDLGVWEKGRNEILKQYQAATNEMNKFTGIAITMVLIFIILLIIYIRKARMAEQNYLAENERAVMLAGQKSEILATMSHEIRNPLTVITGTIYMLNKTVLTEDQQKKLASINLSSTMLIETVNNILDAGKMDHQQTGVLTLVTFDPCHEIKEAVETMKFMAEKKGLKLTSEFTDEGETKVKGDAFRLKQIMINLLSNAIKYTDDGGVTIKTFIRPINEHTAELDVSITDTGIGIPKEHQAKLFTRYYQANRTDGKPGTGLGLYICRQLINLQQGRIYIESDAGKGCCLRFTIPYQKS